MPGGSFLAAGNVAGNFILYASITPAASVTTNSSTVSTYTVTGLLVGDCIDLYPQANLATSTTYLTVGAVWASASNTLSIQWVNSTSATSAAVPTAVPTVIQITRAEQTAFGYKNYPQALE
jgi:hypothetical protein